jgi:thymidylate kinase
VNGSLVVELCGLPGSGKTTSVAGVRGLLEESGRPCRVADAGICATAARLPRSARRLAYAAVATLDHPRSAARAIDVLGRSRQARRSDATRLAVQWLAVSALVARARRRPGVHLLEEGHAQTVWSATLRAPRLRPAALWASLPTGAAADLVLVVDVPPATAAARLRSRSSQHSRTQRLSEDAALAELGAGAALLEEVLADSPAPVLRVPGGGPPGEVAAAALGLLDDVLGGSPTGNW